MNGKADGNYQAADFFDSTPKLPACIENDSNLNNYNWHLGKLVLKLDWSAGLTEIEDTASFFIKCLLEYYEEMMLGWFLINLSNYYYWGVVLNILNILHGNFHILTMKLTDQLN